jgi:hypothetical protein
MMTLYAGNFNRRRNPPTIFDLAWVKPLYIGRASDRFCP